MLNVLKIKVNSLSSQAYERLPIVVPIVVGGCCKLDAQELGSRRASLHRPAYILPYVSHQLKILGKVSKDPIRQTPTNFKIDSSAA